MIERNHSGNLRIMRDIERTLRRCERSPDLAYLLIFSFLYKYSSDILKDHLLSVIQDKEITFDEAYNDGFMREIFKEDADHMFGYFIISSNAYMEDVVNTNFAHENFIQEFILAFVNNVRFPHDSNYKKYFEFIFNTLLVDFNINRFDINSGQNIIVKDLIHSISRLDVFEEALPFKKVFLRICESRFIQVDTDVKLTTELLSKIVSKIVGGSERVYNPFFNDGSSLIDLTYENDFDSRYIYGKCGDKITYCASIVNLFINHFDLDYVFIEYGDATESVDINGESFDVIMSNLPQVGGWDSRNKKSYQNAELYKRNKKRKFITEKLNMDVGSFENDAQLNSALDLILDQMYSEEGSTFVLKGDYEVLNDSEYLFLINLINSLTRDGVMVVSIPQSFLFKNSLQILRKYLTYETSFLDAVIAIPESYSRIRRPEVICIFRKNKFDGDVIFIDASQDLSPRITSRYAKHPEVSPASVNKLIDVYNHRKSIDRYSKVVGIDEIGQNNFNLSVSRYVDTFEGDFVRLSDLKDEKNEITQNIKELNKKIDEMMDELNLKF